MHVMPEVYFKNDVHGHCVEKKGEKGAERGNIKDMLLVIAGAITPFFLTVFLDDD